MKRQKTDLRNTSDNKHSDKFVRYRTRPKVSLDGRIKRKIPQRTKIACLSVLTGIPKRDIFCLLNLLVA